MGFSLKLIFFFLSYFSYSLYLASKISHTSLVLRLYDVNLIFHCRMYNLAYVGEETFDSTFMQRTFGLAMYGYWCHLPSVF